MAHHSGSGQVVPLRRGATDSGRINLHSGRPNHSRPLLRPLSTPRTENAHADVPNHAVTAGDAAQARRFVHMLQTELVLLQRRLDRVGGDQRMREEVKELTARIAELQRLLVALRARFGATANAPTAVRRHHLAPAAATRS